MPLSPLGFEAWIEVEGRRLEEFKVEVREDSVECWVPCESGKAFSLGTRIMTDKLRSSNHTIFPSVDGTKVSVYSNIVYVDPLALEPASRLFTGELVGPAIREFQFGSLQITDDDALLDETSKQFGRISITLFSVERYMDDPDYVWKASKEDSYRVHERTKKGIAHCVKRGEEQPLANKAPIKRAVNSNKLCTFVFNYRQMDVLIANEIAPRPAVGAANPQNAAVSRTAPGVSNEKRRASGKRPLAELKEEDQVAQDLLAPTDEDIENLEARLADMKAKKAQAAASGSSSGPSAKRVKQERKSTLIPGEIIDLTNLPSGSGSRVKREPKLAFLPGEIIDLT